MVTMATEIRYAFRALAKSRGFAVTTLIVLAVGVGASTTVFTVFNAVLLRPLPFSNAERLVAIREEGPNGSAYQSFWGNVAPANLADWESQTDVFEDIGIFDNRGDRNLTGVKEPEHIRGVNVSGSFFSVLGVRASIGRAAFSESEGYEGGLVILSDALWRRRFGAARDIVGKRIDLNERPYTVIGVMPTDFHYPSEAEIWIPWSYRGAEMRQRASHYFNVVGRLRQGVSVAQARSQMTTVAARLQQEYPGTNADHGIAVVELSQQLSYGKKTGLVLLLGAAGLLLLIACANIAGLLLTRSFERQREIAIRAALGASRARLVQQFLTEGLLLSLGGGCLGLVLATAVMAAVRLLAARYLVGADLTMDARVLGFALAVSSLTGAFFGMLPAAYALRSNAADWLKQGGQHRSVGPRQNRANGLIVVSEVVFSSVLLTGACLLIGSLVSLLRTDAGFNAKGLVSISLNLNIGTYRTTHEEVAFDERLIGQLAAIPGVESAAMSSGLPGHSDDITSFWVEGPARPDGDSAAQYYSVSPGYFRTMQIPVLYGRDFSELDLNDSHPAIVVNQTLASRFFPDRSPIGVRIRMDTKRSAYEIIGVVADIRDLGLDFKRMPEIYGVLEQNPSRFGTFLVRTNLPTGGQVGTVRESVRALDADLPIYDVETMEDRLRDSAGKSYFGALLLTLFAAVSIAISAVGIYGTVSYTVIVSKREFAVRMALGAERRDIVRLALTQGLRLGLVGTAIGVAASLMCAPLFRAFLYGVRPSDTRVPLIVSILLLCVALAASIVPAYRASRIDPMIELRGA
jgi:putative ABC transport system permease protein